MAYNPGIEQDDEQQQGQDQGADAGTNQLGGGSGVITGQTSGQVQKQKGSGFVNIGQYLGANQADLAGQTDKAIGKVNEGYTAANQNLASSQAAFNTSADQSRATLGDASTTDDDKQFASDWLKNSKLDNGEQQQFASWQNMNYQGPNELQNTWSADQKKADDMAGTLQSANGYFPAMEQIFGNGRSDYGTGAQRLDASLMAADKTGRERIDQNTKQQQASLGSSIQQATEQANTKAAKYRQEADSGKAAAWEALNSYMPEYASELGDKVDVINNQRHAEYESERQRGPEAYQYSVSNPFKTEQSSAYKSAVDKINSEYALAMEFGDGDAQKAARKKRDSEMATLNALEYTAPNSIGGAFTGADRGQYVSAGEDVGLGVLDQESLAKLNAIYALSGDEERRASLEKELASRFGFDDVMRGDTGAAYTFDQAAFDAKNSELERNAINSALAAEIARRDSLFNRQASFNNNYRTTGWSGSSAPSSRSGDGLDGTVVGDIRDNLVQQRNNLARYF